jgi:beta-lactamase regulating signal transducer with metallopeptidase domain
MIGAIVAAALWALVASLAFTIVLGALVAGTIAIVRPAAATRQALWSVALAAAGFAPIAILAMMLVRGVHATPAPAPAAISVPHAPHQAATSIGHAARTQAGTAPAARTPASGLRLPEPPQLTPVVAGTIAGLWAAGALIGLAGLGRSIARVRALKGRSSPLDGALATELPWLTTTAGREIYLRLSYETETPIAIGFRRPVILLPTEMATADGLTSIEPLIMHEYAHLARYDDWSNLAQRATERLFWFNPLVWILGRRIALEREVAADEAVVARTHDAKRYASTLWRMAQEMRMPEHVVVAPGAMLTRKQISVRIERLLDEHPAGRRYVGAAALAIVIVAATGVAGLAASAPPIALSQATSIAAPTEIASPATRVEPLTPAKPPAAPNVAEHPADMGRRIAVDVQRKLSDAMDGHGITTLAMDTSGPVTRELLSHCIGCDFAGRDLRGLDLSNMSLVGDSFEHANLSGANFSNTKLEGLSFQRADLSHANFHGSKLMGIDFNRSTLDGADLSDATLTGVDLGHASMTGANTAGIKLIGSSLP